MQTEEKKRPDSVTETAPITIGSGQRSGAQGAIAWSSFFFALLQSVCTFLAAVDGLRLIVGAGSLALAASVGVTLDRLHADWIRLPMLAVALIGSLVNLVVLWQVRYLRSRPASQWRIKPPSARKLRMERVQLALSLLTLILIAVEESLHLHEKHHF